MIRALFLAVFLLAGAFPALAQQVEPIDISINPNYPRPNQTVAVTVNSTVLDLSASTVRVSVNGTIVEQGTGVVTAYVNAGNAGSRTTVSVSVTSGGKTYQRQLVIRPADVALVVEATSTAHPFYKGGGLVAPEGRVRLIAVPDIRTAAGAPIAASNLVYTWRFGDQILEGSSGIGRSVLSATAPLRYRDADISVTVSTQDASVVAYAEAVVSPVDPLIRIYKNDPLLGPLFDVALTGSVALADTEETFRMVPYYFGARPAVSWSVNAVESGGDDDITVRSTGNGVGTALLSATANRTETFQSAQQALTVRFGEFRPLGIFGL